MSVQRRLNLSLVVRIACFVFRDLIVDALLWIRRWKGLRLRRSTRPVDRCVRVAFRREDTVSSHRRVKRGRKPDSGRREDSQAGTDAVVIGMREHLALNVV